MSKPEGCAVCGKTLSGRVVLDLWGNTFCSQHISEYPQCKACQRLISERTTGNGVRYPDGRTICNLCRQTAIDTRGQAKPVVEEVAKFLYTMGLRFRGLDLKIEVGDTTQFQQVLMADRSSLTGLGQGQILGFIQKVTTFENGTTTRKVERISLLQGLPSELLQGIAAHELGHAWLYLAKVDTLPTSEEEGFCNFLGYLLYKNSPVKNAAYWAKMIEIDPDPAYGDGFRQVRNIFKKYGFEKTINHLYNEKQLFPVK
jgi:hypothetical protein